MRLSIGHQAAGNSFASRLRLLAGYEIQYRLKGMIGAGFSPIGTTEFTLVQRQALQP
jgi:hypothetical protein